jgi:carbonic anhydrase
MHDCIARIQVNFPEGSCGAIIGSKKLELLQFHFHTPSEHALNGRRYAMEAHLVHREVGTDSLTVLGVMIMRSKGAATNPALRKALDLAPAQGGKVCTCLIFMLTCLPVLWPLLLSYQCLPVLWSTSLHFILRQPAGTASSSC